MSRSMALGALAVLVACGGCSSGGSHATSAALSITAAPTTSTTAHTTTTKPPSTTSTTVAPKPAPTTTAAPKPAPTPPPTTARAVTPTTAAPCPYLGSHPHITASNPPYPASNGGGGAEVTFTGTCFGPNNTDSPGGEGNWSPVEFVVDGTTSSSAGDTAVPASGSFTIHFSLPTNQCGHTYAVQAREGASQQGVPNHVLSNTVGVKPC